MSRAFINQIVQLGVETTPGTKVAATKRLAATMIDLDPQAEANEFQASGAKVDTIVSPGKEWTAGSLTQIANFDEVIYLLTGTYGSVTPTTPTGGTTSKQWVWLPPAFGDTPNLKTFTIEKGDSTAADVITNVMIPDLTFSWDRSKLQFTGNLFGTAVLTNQVLTGSLTPMTIHQALPTNMSIYADSAFGSIGTTKLTAAFAGNVANTGRFTQTWPVNATLGTAYKDVVEQANKATGSLTLENNAAGWAYFTQMRAGSVVYLRFEMLGPIIETTIKYTIWIDMAAIPINPGKYADQGKVYAIPWNFVLVNDSALGGFLKYTVINTLSTL